MLLPPSSTPASPGALVLVAWNSIPCESQVGTWICTMCAHTLTCAHVCSCAHTHTHTFSVLITKFKSPVSERKEWSWGSKDGESSAGFASRSGQQMVARWELVRSVSIRFRGRKAPSFPCVCSCQRRPPWHLDPLPRVAQMVAGVSAISSSLCRIISRSTVYLRISFLTSRSSSSWSF